MLGLCINAANSVPDAAECAALGIGPGDWVRTAVQGSLALVVNMLDSLPPDISVMISLNNECDEVKNDWSGWEDACHLLAKMGYHYPGRIKIVGCGNEIDLWHLQPPVGSPDPRLTPAFAADLVKRAATILRPAGIKVAMSSVASGSWPAYLAEMSRLCRGSADYADLHLYVKRLNGIPNNPDWQTAQSAIQQAAEITGLPVICSEAGIKIDDAGGTAAQATWAQGLNTLSADLVCFWCWHDKMASPGETGGQAFGSRGLDGKQKPVWYALQKLFQGGSAVPTLALVPGLDVSNYQPADVTALVSQYNAKHVVVRASTESDQHRQITRQQCATALQAGCTIGAYIWAYWELDPVSHVKNAMATVQGFDLATVWIDCEDGAPGAALDDWLSRAVAQIEQMGYRAGIYTGTPWWRAQGDSRGFMRLPLWIANYGSAPAIDSVPIPDGWTQAAAHQWTSTPVDQNVFRPSVTQPRAKPIFQEGFGRWAVLEPALIGQPLENEYGPTPGMSAQRTSTGRLVWANLKEGPALFFWGDDGTRHLWQESWPASRLVEAA